jgi:anti-anti-sigma factor
LQFNIYLIKLIITIDYRNVILERSIDSLINVFNNKKIGITIEKSFVNEDDNILLIEVQGILDTNNSSFFSDIIIKIIEYYKTSKIIIIDVFKITYISSTGIGSLVTILTHTRKRSINIHLLKMNEKLKDIFTLLGFTSYFSFINDIKEITNSNNTSFKIINCITCKKRLKIRKPGRFKCPNCDTNIVIEENMKIQL